MKKWLLVLGMITCMFGVSACGKEEAENTGSAAEALGITEEEALMYAEQTVDYIAALCSDPMYSAEKEQLLGEDVIGPAITGWESALEDLGSYEGILGSSAVFSEDGVVITVELDGSERDGKMEIVMDETLMTTSFTTSVTYTFGELMEKAALNTLLGMGTVFCVLVLISLLISCFGFIPKIQEAFAKKPAEEVKPVEVDNTIAQIVRQEEQAVQTDDLELVAVIAAAIAASEGAASTDGFVVRSIRKRRA